MRIGLVCPYSLDVPGGVQNHVSGLAQVLLARGHHVGLLAPGLDTRRHPAHIETVGRAVPIAYNGSVARLAFGPRVASRTSRWLRQGRFDVLHVHEPLTPSVSMLALRAADVPVVATFHAADVGSRTMSSVAGVLRPWLDKISVDIAVSETARDTLVHLRGGAPVVIANGVFCAPLERARPRADWVGAGSTVVFLGRLDEPRKGLSVLLAALPAVVRAHPDARVLVAGRGDRSLAGLPAEVRDRVRFLGEVSDADRARLLASAAVFVAPHTRGESFGIVLVEAMAAGAAVAASDLPAFRTVLGGGRFGRLFTPGDPAEAAEAVIGLLDDVGARQALADRARREARRYDWELLATEIEDVYDGVLSVARR